MTTLADRLRAAIDDAEIHPLHHATCQMMKVPPEGFPFATFSCNCDGPKERLRRCAADRKILDLHTSRTDRPEPDAYHLCPVLLEAGQPCLTLLALAEAYGVEA